jgi:hypothetical protein
VNDALYVLRFFHAVPPVSSLTTGTFVVIALAGGLQIAADPSRAAAALSPVLLLQLFSASSGFAVPARRGHYDLLLTRGVRRSFIAVTHWAASSAAGVVSWLFLALVEIVAAHGDSRALMSSGTCTAMAVVSTLPWALTIGLPRFSGGIGWLLVLMTTAGAFPDGVFDAWGVESAQVDRIAWASWASLVYPMSTVGRDLAGVELAAVVPGIAASAVAMAVAFRWISRMDVPLEAAQ